METSVFIDISLILGIAIGIAFLVQLLKQPLIVSYILTGIVCGPLLLNLINSSQEYFAVFSKFGVILLLFLVGLSLNFDYLRKIGRVAAITGIGQFVFTALIGVLIILALGFAPGPAAFLAISITFSSTIIIMKLLSDKHELMTIYGRYTIGLMLVQDIIAIAIMILLPSLGSSSLIASVLLLLVKIIILVSVVFFLSRAIIPVLLDKAAASPEFLLIFTLAWCFTIAGLGEWTGITFEVGAIIAGLSLGSSVYRTEIESRVKPIRDFFIAAFFIILGSEMHLDNFLAALWPSAVLSLFILVGNPLILYFLYRRLKFTRKTSFLAGLTAAQVSEFGFVFLYIAGGMGYVDQGLLAVFTIVALVTIFASSYLITYNHRVYAWAAPWLEKLGPDKHRQPREEEEEYEALVIGYHRLGWKLCDALREMEVRFAVVDFDPMAVKKLRDRHIPYYFGDATELDFLNELPLHKAKLIVSTLPRPEEQMALVRQLRLANKRAIIIANLGHTKFLDDLYECGADYILLPHLLSGQWLAGILKHNHWDRGMFKELTKKQREELKLKFTMGARS
jgi:Kef-type K+ transport system membrane component KefB